MDTHVLIYIILGFFGLTIPWLKRFEKKQVLNIPLVAIIVGVLIYSLPIDLPDPDPIKYESEILTLSEIAVIISLMGAGLKISRSFSFKTWRVPLLLVVITMTGCIIATTFLGWWFGLAPASALLLGAIFAPTDPVIANDVQVALEEDEREEHPVKFSLTSEAGINDGMAFPFTWLAILMAVYGLNYEEYIGLWLLQDVFYRIIAGLAIGYFSGKAIGWLFFTLPERLKFAPKRLGFLAVAFTFFIYGITEAVGAYGFIAVFVAAHTLRHYEKDHKFHSEMHDVVEQVEQFLLTILLLLLGGYIAQNHTDLISWPMLGLCLAFIFIIRPLFGILPTLKCSMPWKQRWLVAFMGIKGIGSFFYLAFALHETEFEQAETLWSLLALLILLSAVIHRIVGFFVRKTVLK